VGFWLISSDLPGCYRSFLDERSVHGLNQRFPRHEGSFSRPVLGFRSILGLFNSPQADLAWPVFTNFGSVMTNLVVKAPMSNGKTPLRQRSLWPGVVLSCLVAVSNSVSAQTTWPDFVPMLSAGASDSQIAAQLPSDMTVVPPDESLPKFKVRWSGVWQGWACISRQCDIKLAVEQVTESGARIIYAAASEAQAPFVQRVSASFDGLELNARLRTGSKLALRFRPDGDLEFTIWRPDSNLLSAGVLTQKTLVRNYLRSNERVPTPWVENDKPVTLEMIRYAPLGAGPFPTVVINHGSTGEGNRPHLFKFTVTSLDVVGYFVNKGWQVVFPQRRGRGGSGGKYEEGFERDGSRYSCEAALSLPGLERALSDLDAVMTALLVHPEVDPKRLLVGGISRGGILSVVYAGTRKSPVLGVLNFVGGWVGDQCNSAEVINTASFARGAAFTRPMLWLYGERDPYYSMQHSQKNFATFEAAGGKGVFHRVVVPEGQDGHSIHTSPGLWAPLVDDYLSYIGSLK
jgi:dienelactone hydrolase